MKKYSEIRLGASALVMTDARVRLVQHHKAEFPHPHGKVDVDVIDRIKLFIKPADEIP